MRDEVAAVLVCPRCRSDLRVEDSTMVCPAEHRYPVVDGVPVFTAAGAGVERRQADHHSHTPPAELVDLLVATGGPWLNLGAGATTSRYERSIELETALFTNTDVIGDAVSLPFATGSLTGTLALNVFEHLADPDGAARELHRVVRPGGLIAIQTAFLQPLHADPEHYFNATEAGVRRWFRGFDIQSVTVPTNLNPLYAMSWMCSDLLYHAPEELAGRLSKLTVGQLAEVWKRQLGSGSTWATFMALPEHAQRPLAAGFQLLARRPTS